MVSWMFLTPTSYLCAKFYLKLRKNNLRRELSSGDEATKTKDPKT